MAPPPLIHPKASDYRELCQRLTGMSLRECPHCKRGSMIQVEVFLP
jgi:hypothetical protein